MKNNLIIKEELNQIWIYANNKADKTAVVNNNPNLIKELEKYTWGYVVHHKDTEYFKTGATPPYYLHQFIVDFYYGRDFRKSFTDRGFVVDHLNNNGLDNTIENLQFITRGENSSKSSLDKKVANLNYDSTFSINFKKDFKTGKYLFAILNSYEAVTYHFVYDSFDRLRNDIEVTLIEISETKGVRKIIYAKNYERLFIEKHFDEETRIKAINKTISSPEDAIIEVNGRFIVNLGSNQIFNYKPAVRSELLEE